MITETVINLGVVGATCLIVLFYLIRFVFRYKHEYESNPLCTFTVVFCLVVVLMAAFVLPVDIFLASFVKNSDGSLKEWATNQTLANIDRIMFGAYYSLYGVSILLVSVVIPFLHFLNEESETNARDRFFTAVKYTFALIVFQAMLLTFGALSTKPELEPNSIFSKISQVANTTKFEDAASLVLGVVTLCGFVNVTFYTASGIFSWPVGLFLGTASIAQRVNFIHDRETLVRIRISALQEKSRGNRLTPTEREQLNELESELRELEREETTLSGYNDTWNYRLRKAIRPLQKTIGAILFFVSLMLVATLVISNIDRLIHGAGSKQGYLLLKPTIFNPLEYACIKLSDLILLGPLPILLIMCFLVVATISGTRNLGLRFLFTRLHQIKIGRTQPQALLIFCMTVMLTALAFNLTIYSMTTEYVTFGNQKIILHGENSTQITEYCTLADYHPDCIPTRGSILLFRMISRVWVFGLIFYWWTWAFVVVSSISLIAYVVRGKRDAISGMPSDQDEFED